MKKNIVAGLLTLSTSAFANPLLLAKTALETAGRTKHCTLTPIEQDAKTPEYYGTWGRERAIGFSVDLSKGDTYLSYGLSPRSETLNGVLHVIAYDLVPTSAETGVIKIWAYKTGINIDTNFGGSGSAWDKEKIHSQIVMYRLPDDRLAILALACR